MKSTEIYLRYYGVGTEIFNGEYKGRWRVNLEDVIQDDFRNALVSNGNGFWIQDRDKTVFSVTTPSRRPLSSNAQYERTVEISSFGTSRNLPGELLYILEQRRFKLKE